MRYLKKILLPALCFFQLASCAAQDVASAPAVETIIFLRHAEKPDLGLGQLSCQGLNRALALPAVLRKRFGDATALYAPNPSGQKPDSGVRYDYIRPLATLEPMAIQMGLPINVQWGYDRIKPLEDALLSDGLKRATVFVAWEHKIVEIITRELMGQVNGGDEIAVPPWGGNDFDSLYIVKIRTDAAGRRTAELSIEKQGLDGQSRTCPGEVHPDLAATLN